MDAETRGPGDAGKATAEVLARPERRVLASGDEAIVETSRAFDRRLNPESVYSNVAGWTLAIEGHTAQLIARRPLNAPVLTITAVMLTFFTGFYVLCVHLKADRAFQWAVPAVAIVSIGALLGLTSIGYWLNRKRGPWLEIDGNTGTVTVSRFGETFRLQQAKLLLTTRSRLAPQDRHSGEFCDLDLVIEAGDERFVRFSLVREMGSYASRLACAELKKRFGIETLERTKA